MIVELKQPERAAFLFEGWQETLIWSCLQNVMGHIHVNSMEEPASAMALLGDFCFFAGKPEKELILYGEEVRKRRFMIMVPQNEAWAELIQSCFGDKARRVTRYALKKEPDVFDRVKLQRAVDSLPCGYSMKMLDEELFYRCQEISWARDWVSNYEDFQQYERIGLGAVILKGGEPVSGASSYSSYREGLEIEIVTKKEYRRKGLAFICSAKLILECMERGWYPSWDAQNKGSLALAEKLGYHFDHEYPAYEIWED